MKITYKKIQEYIVEPLPPVDVLREKIIFHAFEVESVEDIPSRPHDEGAGGGDGDYELDIKVLPDRAHDAKEARGMAREIAALFNLNLTEPDVYERTKSIVFSITKVSTLLGREITIGEIKKVFDAYHYQYSIEGDSVTLFVPPWRVDMSDIHDVCDEIGRYLGYDTIPPILPKLNTESISHNPEYVAIVNKKKEMIDLGYHEVMTYSFTKKGDYQVAKGPKGKDFLRTDLLSGLRISYAMNKQNEPLLPNNSANIFEIGKVFKKGGEELHIAWIDTKGEREEVLDTTNTNFTEASISGSLEDKAFKMWSLYPFITRDIAVWTSESDKDKLVAIITDFANKYCVKEATKFDEFTKPARPHNEGAGGDGRTSLAYRFVFQSYDKTLTDEEVEEKFSILKAEISSNSSFEIR